MGSGGSKFFAFCPPFHIPYGAYVNQMRLTVLASGSKGNSAVVASSRTRVLVDAGLSCRELLRRMALAGEDPGQALGDSGDA